MVCGDEVYNDDFHIRQELVNTRDTRFLYLLTYAIKPPNGVSDGFTASDAGFKYFCSGHYCLQMELNKHTWLLSI
jgi:hypothetical protein